jgi:hypothetical protein
MNFPTSIPFMTILLAMITLYVHFLSGNGKLLLSLFLLPFSLGVFSFYSGSPRTLDVLPPMITLYVYGLLEILINSHDLKENHLLSDMVVQPTNVISHHILVKLVHTQLNALPPKLRCILLISFSLYLYEIMKF